MSAYIIPANLAVSETGFLFVPGTGETFTMNESGRRILKELQNRKTTEEILDIFLEEYDVDKITIEKDIIEFVNQLKTHKLVQEI